MFDRMTKTIRISGESHELARAKAKTAGMKFYRFVEMAIAAFQPVITIERSQPTKPRRKVG